MATILHFSTICGIFCLIHYAFADGHPHKLSTEHQESEGKHEAKNQPLHSKAQIRSSKADDEKILLKSDSALRGRTIHQTAWSREEKEDSESGENSRPTEKNVLKSEDLKKFLKYVMKMVNKLEEREKHEKHSSRNRKNKITDIKDNSARSHEETVEVLEESRETSDDIEKNPNVDELMSAETQNYISTFFHSDSKTRDHSDKQLVTDAASGKEKLTIETKSNSAIEIAKKSLLKDSSKFKNHSEEHVTSQKIIQSPSSKDEFDEKIIEEKLNENVNGHVVKTKEIERIDFQRHAKIRPTISLRIPNQIKNKEKIIETKQITGTKVEKHEHSDKAIVPHQILKVSKLENIGSENSAAIMTTNINNNIQSGISKEKIEKIISETETENDIINSKNLKLKKIDVPIKLPQNVKIKNVNNVDELEIGTRKTKNSDLSTQNTVSKIAELNKNTNTAKLNVLKNKNANFKENLSSLSIDNSVVGFKETKVHHLNHVIKDHEKVVTSDKMKYTDSLINIATQPLDSNNVKVASTSSQFQTMPSFNIKNKYDAKQINTFSTVAKSMENKFENQNAKFETVENTAVSNSKSVLQNFNTVGSFTADKIKNHEKDKIAIHGASNNAIKNSVVQTNFKNKNVQLDQIGQKDFLKSQKVVQSYDATNVLTHQNKNLAENHNTNLIISSSGSTIESSLNQKKNENTNFGFIGQSELNAQKLLQNTNTVQKFENNNQKNLADSQNIILSSSSSTVGSSIAHNKLENKNTNLGVASFSEVVSSQNSNVMQKFSDDSSNIKNVVSGASSGHYLEIAKNNSQNGTRTSELNTNENVISSSSFSLVNNKVINNAEFQNKENAIKISETINSKDNKNNGNTVIKTKKFTNSYDYILTSNEFIDVNESAGEYSSDYEYVSCEYEDSEEDEDEEDVSEKEDIKHRDTKQASSFSSSSSMQEEKLDAKTEKTYNTILEYLYKHSTNPFFVALKKKSENYSNNLEKNKIITKF